MTLTWNPPAKDGGSPVTNYVVEYRDAKRTTWSKAGDVSADKTFYVADRLITGNDYYFRVIAVNDEGQGQPLESLETVRPEKQIGMLFQSRILFPQNLPFLSKVRICMLCIFFYFSAPPKAPSNLTVKKIDSNSATINWKPPQDDGGSKVTGYKVKVKEEGSDQWKDLASLTPYDTEYTAKNLKTGKGYHLAVVAENKAGLGEAVETESSIVPRKKPGMFPQ